MADKILRGNEYQPTLKNLTVGEFFFEYGEKNGDKICQIDADLDKFETYASVRERSIKVAIQLQKKGVTSNDVITSCSYNTLDNTIPIIAALYLGAKVVNLDPTLSARNTRHLISLVKPRMIFVQEESLHLIENSLSGTQLTPEIIVFGESTKYGTFTDLVVPSPQEKDFRPVKVDIHDIAVMFFSSGTTGLPKAISHSHYSFLMITDMLKEAGFDCTRIIHFTSFYWISGMMMLSRTFYEGTTRVFARALEGESTFKMIEKYKLTSIFTAPIHTYKLTSVEKPQRYDVSSFRCLLTGGTPMSTEQYKKLTVLFPNAQIVFGYGMTEVGMVSVFHEKRHERFIRTKIGSCGAVAPLTSIKVVKPDSEEICGANEKGEIRVKSPGLMKGYYQMDSSSSFDSEGYLRTGDIGYYDDDKCIYVIERLKEMFKYQSWHIVPSSIEAVLLEHPAVKETVVFGIPRGEDGEVPAACVVLNEGFNVDKEEIESFVEERVSDREKLRGGVIFLDVLPRTPTGKLIRNEVRNVFIKSM